jgi:hypothetical protein
MRIEIGVGIGIENRAGIRPRSRWRSRFREIIESERMDENRYEYRQTRRWSQAGAFAGARWMHVYPRDATSPCWFRRGRPTQCSSDSNFEIGIAIELFRIFSVESISMAISILMAILR